MHIVNRQTSFEAYHKSKTESNLSPRHLLDKSGHGPVQNGPLRSIVYTQKEI